MMRSRLALGLAVAAFALPSGIAPAQGSAELQAAIAAGIVGERYDGYLGFAGTPSQRVAKQVGAINITRRTLYTDLAVRRNVTPSVAAVAVGCELLSRVAVGQVYMLSDGRWHRRGPQDPPPRPAHCG